MRSPKQFGAILFALVVLPVSAATVQALPPAGFSRLNPDDFQPVVIEEPVRPLTIAVAPTPKPYIATIRESIALAPTPPTRPKVDMPTVKAKSESKATPRLASNPRSVAVSGPYGVVEGSRIARAYAQSRLSGTQYNCLNQLWIKESGWRWNAGNPTSGAYGIPQALPGSKMATAGADWRTNPITQVKWGLGYISGRYGSPCKAYAHWQSRNWY